MGDGKIARSYRTDNKCNSAVFDRCSLACRQVRSAALKIPDDRLENVNSVARVIEQRHDHSRHQAIDAE
jgi:hypothetical protein